VHLGSIIVALSYIQLQLGSTSQLVERAPVVLRFYACTAHIGVFVGANPPETVDCYFRHIYLQEKNTGGAPRSTSDGYDHGEIVKLMPPPRTLTWGSKSRATPVAMAYGLGVGNPGCMGVHGRHASDSMPA
jgi:hypothetical protein